MSPALNLLQLMGNLCADPDLRFTGGGLAICKIRLAVNREWKDKTGQKQKETTYVTCSAFDKAANTLAQYLHKGDPLYVAGRLSIKESQTDSGEKRWFTECLIDQFQFLGGPKGERSQSGPAAHPNAGADMPPDDDIPF